MIYKTFLLIFCIAVIGASPIKEEIVDETDVYAIRSALSPLLALAIQPDNYNEIGSYVRLQRLGGNTDTDQSWQLNYQNEPGLFTISTSNGQKLSGDDNQYPYIHLHGSGTPTVYHVDVWAINSDGHIVNIYHNKHLSVATPNASSLIGNDLILEEEDRNSLAQKFYFDKL